jgi:nucleoside-diphosphate-sugar epimerase
VDGSKGFWPGHTYSEDDWNPITADEATENPMMGYRASKTFAEKAAWDFLEKEKPNFSISTINPPMVYGPIVRATAQFLLVTADIPQIHALDSLDNMNTSNQRILSAAQGKFKDEIPASGVHLWVDVRDVAEAHVAAFEKAEAAIKDLPSDSTPGGDYPEGTPEKGLYGYSNKRSIEMLGLKYKSLEQCIVDTVKSFQKKGL